MSGALVGYGCFNHYGRGTCDNKRTIKRQVIEARVIAGLKDKLLTPDLVAEFIKAFQEETNALNHDRELATAQDQASYRFHFEMTFFIHGWQDRDLMRSASSATAFHAWQQASMMAS